MHGVAYVAYGQNARRAAAASIASLRRHHNYPVVVASDGLVEGADHHVDDVDPRWGARWAKLCIDRWIPGEWGVALYLDADTIVLDDLSAGFGWIDDGWSIALAPSKYQGHEWLQHVSEAERARTFDVVQGLPFVPQAGMFFFDPQGCARLFAHWREEWLTEGRMDQAALLRALWRCRETDMTFRIWPLHPAWNGRTGSVVTHLFGQAR